MTILQVKEWYDTPKVLLIVTYRITPVLTIDTYTSYSYIVLHRCLLLILIYRIRLWFSFLVCVCGMIDAKLG